MKGSERKPLSWIQRCSFKRAPVFSNPFKGDPPVPLNRPVVEPIQRGFQKRVRVWGLAAWRGLNFEVVWGLGFREW